MVYGDITGTQTSKLSYSKPMTYCFVMQIAASMVSSVLCAGTAASSPGLGPGSRCGALESCVQLVRWQMPSAR